MRYWLLPLVILWATMALAQHRLEVITTEEAPKGVARPENLPDAGRVQAELQGRLLALYGAGYLEASFDSCTTEGTTTTCHLHLGRNYRWARLSSAGVPAEIASQARFREKFYSGQPVTPRQVARLVEGLIRHAEDNGHPFVQVWLDSLKGPSDGMEATVRMDLGRLVRYDSILVRGSAKTSMPYLHAHIGIKPGDAYNESLLRNLDRRIRELPFVTQRQRAYVQFTDERTKLFLFLDARKASSINGILGVQPDPLTDKVGITGDLDLRLRNALKRGEAIDLNWRSLQDQTQDLRLRLNMPFLFNTPFGTDLGLKLFKRDSTFLEVTARAALEYLLMQGDRVSFFVNNKSSDRLGSNLVSLPGLADVRLLSYGVGVERERFDYRFNPRSGLALRLEGSAGRKRTSKAVFGEAVPTTTIRTVQYELNGSTAWHIPVARRATIRFAGQGGWMINDDLHLNELYRVGGIKSMRGVDEASIFCSAFAIGTVEFRYLYEENANFFMFVDQGWWEDRHREDPLEDNPLGFGLGTSFETKAGIFGITYALARQFGNPIVLRSGKIHFGFTSLF